TQHTIFPYTTLFRSDAQDAAYKESVLPKAITKRVAVEMGASFAWAKYTGLNGAIVGIDRFGASGKGDLIQEEYGFTAENVKPYRSEEHTSELQSRFD